MSKRKRKEVGPVPEDLTAEQWNQLSRWVNRKHPWAVEQLEDLVEACLNHHEARDNEAGIVNWVAACRTWILNEKLWRRRSGTPGQTPARSNEKPSGLAAASRAFARDLGLFGSN